MKTKCTRGIIYFIGLIVLALGIVLNTKTLLGTSSIIFCDRCYRNHCRIISQR
ncbi:MAG: hypothetical protein UDG85_08780 [Anaerostipes hadrus]|nr:hypothetical protein [Anaerostipes hadrus]